MLQNNLVNLAAAQPYSVAIAAVSMGDSISMLMQNAVLAEKNSQSVQTACVVQCCALMIPAGLKLIIGD